MFSFRSLFLFLIVSLFLGSVFADFSATDFISQFQTKQATLSSSEKKTYYVQVYNNLSLLAIRNRNDIAQSKIFESLKTYVKSQMQALWSPSSTTTISFTLASSGLFISNVDSSKVRDAWLALHNTERQANSLTPFTYSTPLEWTASTWANHLADMGVVSHKRKNTDWYYSYASIKTRFSNQWIVFVDEEQNGQPLFTENIWWNLYSCKKADCTDDFIKAIKKSRTLFMSEKGKSYRPHYNAIVGNFTSIGLWVSLIGNKYYLVSHYSQALK